MAAYVIADTEITNHQTYDEYKRQVAPLIANRRPVPRAGRQTCSPRRNLAAPTASSSLSFQAWKLSRLGTTRPSTHRCSPCDGRPSLTISLPLRAVEFGTAYGSASCGQPSGEVNEPRSRPTP